MDVQYQTDNPQWDVPYIDEDIDTGSSYDELDTQDVSENPNFYDDIDAWADADAYVELDADVDVEEADGSGEG